MIKLAEIADAIINKHVKAFGDRASRMTTADMHLVFNELKSKIGSHFNKFEIAKSLPTKADHGDLDIVAINNKGFNIFDFLKQQYGESIQDTLKSGNVNSFLFKSESIGKSVHVDIITVGSDENFGAQHEYLSYGDFAGILGVMSRKLRFKYATTGFWKIYEDEKQQYHCILLTKYLREGLEILGYGSVIEKYDKIQTLDDVVNFIKDSPLFDSDYYKGIGFNNSDRKRVRVGRKSADYIRNGLKDLNKHRTIDDNDYFLKTLFPEYYKNLQNEIEKIKTTVIPKSIYNGDFIIKNFNIKPGPIIGKIQKFLKDKFGEDLDNKSVEEVTQAVTEFIKYNYLGL